MKVLICGSRTVSSPDLIHRMVAALDQLHAATPVTQVIAGGARGADSIGAAWAKRHDLPLEVVPAQWDRHGRSAGFKRNLLMLDMAPDLVVAFVDKPLSSSRGTAHTVENARARHIDTRIFRAAS